MMTTRRTEIHADQIAINGVLNMLIVEGTETRREDNKIHYVKQRLFIRLNSICEVRAYDGDRNLGDKEWDDYYNNECTIYLNDGSVIIVIGITGDTVIDNMMELTKYSRAITKPKDLWG